ncbi:MAG: hypothetical protein GY759_17745, partial [Chloroflexi bacterium]|nr:hypothetical protein [Chloroflexota bacterium]
EQYISAVAKEEHLYEQHEEFSCWLGHLCDALEVVDWRSGEIRDRDINEWLLTKTLTALEAIDHPRVQRWVKTLRRHQDQLLTYLDWLSASLQPYQIELAQHLNAPEEQKRFMRLVARCWRLRQGVINGHKGFRSPLELAQQDLDALLASAPHLSSCADCLTKLLDAAARSSSMIENINGLLKQFLHNRRAFRNSDTLQNYLNLFTLWYNTHLFARGKRKGQTQVVFGRKNSPTWGDHLQVADAAAWAHYQQLARNDSTYTDLVSHLVRLIRVGVDTRGVVRPLHELGGEE